MKTPKFWRYNGLVTYFFVPFSFIYGAVTQWRIKFSKPYKSKAYVICIGNITAGGVGKTPVAIAMAEKYLKQGKKVFFVTRGYKGKLKNILVDLQKHSVTDTGDEARLLAYVAPTIVAPKRDVGAKMAEKLGAEVIIMDDGFQNPRLYKDESWLVFDGAIGIGNGKIIPSGPLRETLIDGEKRAQNVLIMGEDKTHLADKVHLPVYYGKLVAEPLALENKKVVAFAGIGHPAKFYQTLRDLGFDVVKTHDFEDHHAYNDAEIEKIIKEAENLPVVTTEKDFVKLSFAVRNMVHVLKVHAVWE